MNYREGSYITVRRAYWDFSDADPAKCEYVDPDDRTPANATWIREAVRVVGPEWLPKNQRMVVRLIAANGKEFNLTRRELALNGATTL